MKKRSMLSDTCTACTPHGQFMNLNLNFGVYRDFQQYFSYIMAASFSGGGSRSTRRGGHPKMSTGKFWLIGHFFPKMCTP